MVGKNEMLKGVACALVALFFSDTASARGVNPDYKKWIRSVVEKRSETNTTSNSMAPNRKAMRSFSAEAPSENILENLGNLERISSDENYGYKPSLIDYKYLNIANIRSPKLCVGDSLPPKYDSRDYGWVSSVKNQNPFGTCWAHAAIGAVEVTLRRENPGTFVAVGQPDLSENNMVMQKGYDIHPYGNADPLTLKPSEYSAGGFFEEAFAYLGRWSDPALGGGPIYESEDIYPSAANSYSTHGSNVHRAPAFHIQEYIKYPPKTKALDHDEIKDAIRRYGSVWVSYCATESDRANVNGTIYTFPYISSDRKSFYHCSSVLFGEKDPSNHAVLLIGWDDSYPKENFVFRSSPSRYVTPAPPGDGAYLIKNSWGTDQFDEGFLWVSYYDDNMLYDESYVIPTVEKKDNFSEIYQHDPLGLVYTFPDSDYKWGANVFTAVNNASIAAVGFYSMARDTTYTIQIYTGCSEGNPVSGTCRTGGGKTGVVPFAGYTTVMLDSPITITAGQRFSVVLSLNSPGCEEPFGAEVNLTYKTDWWSIFSDLGIKKFSYSLTSGAKASAGQSFVSKSGANGTWRDITTEISPICVEKEGYFLTVYGEDYFDEVMFDTTSANLCIKAYTQAHAVAKELKGVEITGTETSIIAGGKISLSCTAKYNNEPSKVVTDVSEWSIVKGYGDDIAHVISPGVIETSANIEEMRLVRVQATYEEDGVSKSDTWDFNVSVAPPMAPRDISATQGTEASCVRVSWTPSRGATEYRIYRSTTNNKSNARYVDKVSVAKYNDDPSATGLVPGVDYWYFIKAWNKSGLSDSSEGVSGWCALSAPTDVTASDGTSLEYVEVKWSEVVGAKTYHVYRLDVEGIEGEMIAIGSWQPETSYQDKTAAPNKTYRYYVRAAIDSQGTRASESSIFDDGYVGVPVTLDYITIDGDASIPSGGNATYTCTATYTDKSTRTAARPSWTMRTGSAYATVDSTGKVTAKTVTANQTVTLQASYTDGVNRKATKQITITATVPSAPSSVTLVSATTEAVTIGWSSVAGSAGYSVWRGSTTADAKKIADVGTATEYADESGTPGVSYTYWVKASNSAGESDFSAMSVTATRGLVAPTGVVASDGTYTDKTLITWKPVTGATYYRVARAGSATGAKTELGSWQSATSYEDKSGTEGTHYWYFVKAATSSSGANASAYSTYDEGWRPIVVTLSSIEISGATKLAAGGSTVLSCTAKYSSGSPKTVKPEWSVSPTTAATIDADGKLTAKRVTENVTVTVTARFTDGTTKTDTHEIVIVAPIVATAEVKNVQAKTRWPFSNFLDVDYELVTQPAGTRALVTLSGHDDDKDVAMAARTLTGDGATGPVEAGKHRLTWDVAADYPDFHAKAFSVEMSAVAMSANMPSNVTASAGTSTAGVNIGWAAIDDATGYEVWRNTSSATNGAECIQTTDQVAYTDTGATAGTTYWYWVRSITPDGKSDFGKPVSGWRAYADITVTFNPNGGSVSPTSKPYSPTKTYDSLPTASRTGYDFDGWYTASSGGTKVTTASIVPTAATTLWAHWTANTYWISFNANGGSGSMSNLSMTYDVSKNLTANAFALTGYSFIGWATTSGGSVVYGNGASVKNLTTGNGSTVTLYAKWQANIPSAPTGVSATDGQAGSVTVSWSAVSIATSYEIWRNTSSSTSGAVKIGTSTTTSFTDTTAPISTTCYYWVKAVNAMGTSGWSSYDSGYRVLGAPTNVSASDNTLAVGIRITWDAVDGADSYAIYRGTSSSSSSATQIGTSMGPAYIDSDVASGTTSYYFIKATRGSVASAFSAYDKGSRKAGEPLYVVVDLSGGTSAGNYPVSELSAVPSGGWTDEYKTNKLVLRRIANGSYTMGCETSEVGYYGYEAQPHQVTISKPFYIGVFEVTQKQYELVMGSNPSSFKGDARPVEYVSYNAIRGSLDGAKWPSANSVDSTSFMGKIRARTGLTFDLPTEAQWEYACRAGTTTALNSGKNLTNTSIDANMAEVGRCSYNRSDGKGGYSSEHTTVGSYLPNIWGLYDMHGNVGEWCLDWYVSRGTSGFDSGPVTDPKGVSSDWYRVVRSGDWTGPAQKCRSAYRHSGCNPSGDFYWLGFRLCCPAGLMLTPPTGVSATDGTSATGVTVTWNSVSSATSYNIWRGVHNASGAAEKIGTVMGTSYTDTSAVAGTQYWYWVEAVNSSYSSGFTAWDTGYRKLGSPSGVSATAGTGANTISWSAVADATSYKILRGTSSTYSSATQIGTVTTATYSDATALPGQGYYYWVVAVNEQGESAPSSYVYTSGWQLAAPTGVSASDGTYYDKVVISWGAVTGASAYYIYRYTSNNSGSASQIGSSTTTSYEDKTAVAGTTYYYWVRAYNADSKAYSAFSAVDSGSRKKLSTPSGVSATAGAGAIAINWSAVADATSYKILRGTSTTYANAEQIGTATTAAYTDATALPGRGYYYWIVAVNDYGESASSTYVYTSGWQLAAPTGVSASDGTTVSGVELTWDPVAGSTSYQILRDGTSIGTATAATYLDSGAATDRKHSYTVKSCAGSVTSGASKADSGYRGFTITTTYGTTYGGVEIDCSGQSNVVGITRWNMDGTLSGDVEFVLFNMNASDSGYGNDEYGRYYEWYSDDWGNYRYYDSSMGDVYRLKKIADYDIEKETDYWYRAKTEDGRVSLPAKGMIKRLNLTGLYVVIDMSDGAKAFNFPVVQLSAMPSGGWGDEYLCTKLVLRRIEPDTFMMGNPNNGNGDADYHQVTLTKPYYMGVYQMSEAQLARVNSFLWETLCVHRWGGSLTLEDFEVGGKASKMSSSIKRYSNYNSSNTDPIVNVPEDWAWLDMGQVVVRQLSRKTGVIFNTSTEAEWEYACRAGTTGSYSNTNLANPNYADLCNPNNWGLYGMHNGYPTGNRGEYCRDFYKIHLGSTSVVDPVTLTGEGITRLREYLGYEFNSNYYDSHVIRGVPQYGIGSAVYLVGTSYERGFHYGGQWIGANYRPFCYAGQQ